MALSLLPSLSPAAQQNNAANESAQPAATASNGHALTVSIEGLRNQKGQILVCLTANQKAFPDCSKDAASVRMGVPAGEAGQFIIQAPRSGNYAIAVVHDENGNNKMDKAIFLPKEGFGFSRNPTITTGPPRFSSASFAVNGPQRQSIKMRYML